MKYDVANQEFRVSAAKLAHESLCIYKAYIGESPGVGWSQLELSKKDDLLVGVDKVIWGLGSVTPEDIHNVWLVNKLKEGWKYGDTKITEQKIHPNITLYDQLPPEQQLKGWVFLCVVQMLIRAVTYLSDNSTPLEVSDASSSPEDRSSG